MYGRVYVGGHIRYHFFHNYKTYNSYHHHSRYIDFTTDRDNNRLYIERFVIVRVTYIGHYLIISLSLYIYVSQLIIIIPKVSNYYYYYYPIICIRTVLNVRGEHYSYVIPCVREVFVVEAFPYNRPAVGATTSLPWLKSGRTTFSALNSPTTIFTIQ
jgi:hypothetical protein